MPVDGQLAHLVQLSTGQWVLLLAVGGALAFGLWRGMVDGRFRGTHSVRGSEAAAPAASAQSEPAAEESVLAGTEYADRLGSRATLLQFSSVFCAPCRATRRILEAVSAEAPEVAHLEIDAESHLDLVRRVGVMRTPTTLVLDAAGREVTRASGAPTRAQVLAALALLP